ncbi:MAG TPA: protein-disulfide reductase DsbD N-terminal domain-containing protein [Pyrinomonadaceae bacterium]|jgi:DsbC/DsbD-like thiol-disulfide interchange protein|nr:protein-disulfide reductase DsbD N-terminal domain-containing protein [Pyrinomonadaceae bacterium]
MKSIAKLLLVVTLCLLPQNFFARSMRPRALAPQPNIEIKGYYSANKVSRGRVVRATIQMDIPGGYHVNANKPLGKYAIPTTIKIEAPQGVVVGPIIFPRALIRNLKAVNNERLAVYEGRAVFRFNVTIPANYGDQWMNLRAHVRYQSCNDDVCFPPKNQDIDFGLSVGRVSERGPGANGAVYGGT